MGDASIAIVTYEDKKQSPFMFEQTTTRVNQACAVICSCRIACDSGRVTVNRFLAAKNSADMLQGIITYQSGS